MHSLNTKNVFMTPRVKIIQSSYHDYPATPEHYAQPGIQAAVDRWLDEEPRYITQPPSVVVSNGGATITMTFLWHSQEDIEKLNEAWRKAWCESGESRVSYLPDNGRPVRDDK